VIRPGDALEARDLYARLDKFESENGPLLGLTNESRDVFVAQVIESLRRVRFLRRLRGANIDAGSLDPQSGAFDPLKGAVYSARSGSHDEAFWLVFLATHFGRSRTHGWALSGNFYGRLGQGGVWSWSDAAADPEAVVEWLEANEASMRALGIGFGNHRKYQSLKARGSRGTGAAVTTYVNWVGSSHAKRIADGYLAPTERFASLFDSLQSVAEFGRTARFDYLATLGKLELADIEADSLHLAGATGPLTGARLLLSGSKSSKLAPCELELRLAPLRKTLEVSYDVLEDALCNWQKSPSSFVPFRG
jgi:hypothetical protein